MATDLIDLCKDFSSTPGGRYRLEGVFSGEEFREDFVEPKLNAGHDVVIDIDGVEGLSSSFLEEVFGGLIRKFGARVVSRVEVRAATKPFRARKVKEFVERAIADLGSKPDK